MKFSESQRPDISKILRANRREIEQGKRIEFFILLCGYILLFVLLLLFLTVEFNGQRERREREQIWLLNSYWEKEID